MSRPLKEHYPSSAAMIRVECEDLAGLVLEHMHTLSPNRLRQASSHNLANDISQSYESSNQKIYEMLFSACEWLIKHDFLKETDSQRHFTFTEKGKGLKTLIEFKDFLSEEESKSALSPNQTTSNAQRNPKRALSVFLCHSSGDKPAVRELYNRLRTDGFDPWIDEENLLPGQDWQQKIPEAVSTADIVLVCLSRGSITKKGYVQKEIKYALDVADQQPEDTIYLIPIKLEECDIPERLRRWHWVSLLEPTGYGRLLNALKHHAESISLNPNINNLQPSSVSAITRELISNEVLPETQGKPLAKNTTRKRPEETPLKDTRRKRIRKLSWVGLGPVIVIGVIVWITAIRPSNINLPNAETYYNRGYECSRKENYDCAVENFTKAIELNPQYVEAYHHRGAAYHGKGDEDLAINDFNKAIELNPQHAEAYIHLGITYYDKGDYDEALKDYSKAIELDPESADAYNNRGNAYDKKGDYDEAIKNYDKAIELDTQPAQVYYNRGNTYLNKGDYDEALKDYSKAIELDPESATAYNNRGNIYDRKGEYDKAIKDFTESIRLKNPELHLPYVNRGNAYKDKGDYDLAINDFNKAIELNPQAIEAYHSLGNIYYDKGNYDEALKDYDKAIALDPQHAEAYRGRALAYKQLRQFAKAKADYQKYNELSKKGS